MYRIMMAPRGEQGLLTLRAKAGTWVAFVAALDRSRNDAMGTAVRKSLQGTGVTVSRTMSAQDAEEMDGTGDLVSVTMDDAVARQVLRAAGLSA